MFTVSQQTNSGVPDVHVLSLAQVRELMPLTQALETTRQALIAHALGAVSQPDPWHLHVTDTDGALRGQVHVKGAHIHGAAHYAVKLAFGFYGNKELGVPVSGGLSIIADASTGHPVILALDNGYLTDARTGAAGAIAAQALSRPDARRIALIGPGTQAAYQLRALLHVRQPSSLVLYGRDRARADAFARSMRALDPWEVTVAGTVEEAVHDADIVITTTPARSPLVHGEWLAPGTHVTAVGSDTPGKQELDLSVLRRASVIAADDPRQCKRLGELQHAVQAGIADALPIETLGHILAGHHPGRRSDTDITIADLTGLGAQDSAVAAQLALTLTSHTTAHTNPS